MAAKYAINLKDGTIVYRSKATDAMPVLFRWIPDEVAKGIMEKRIDPKKVTNIIMKKVFASENFDHSEYEAELKKLNVVFKEDEVPEPEEVVNTDTDNIADSVSMDELGAGAAAPAEQPAEQTAEPPAAPAEEAAPKKPGRTRNGNKGSKAAPAEPPAAPAEETQGEEVQEELGDM